MSETKKSPLVIVDTDVKWLVISFVFLLIIIFASFKFNFSVTVVFLAKYGFIGVIGLYIYFQAFVSRWLLYSEKLIVKRPLRPILNYYEFYLDNISAIDYSDINIGKLNSMLIITCKDNNKKYGFGFTGNATKMDELLTILKEKGITVRRQSTNN